ncbi:hypothetical protein AKJ37_04785 [candidate division MSBL1 archaeon SCGC-AAA259I09]|uniref:DUF211 domain-containing protein n=3 Tax=candidate division MSBL1 TaxID=215777 RepID=A0A133UR02_9EURY|nr:hypothetical protein AKJ66_03115 [candidate division MSBL1 archaeon SCGC-AAA259E22]KXA96628.1 hypothetical protein AKJ37_04785 [candidate division MSBL1 archaeon SCGC-AAA259I09]KXA98758.1 hypothetical protein AKJ40_04490 [candidate division MSBL1 archaeon SCGC-AAA259M10]
MAESDSKEPKVWRIVLDVLKPHDPSLPEFAKQLGMMDGVDGVDVALLEIDKETETLKVTVDGDLNYSEIRSKIEDWGGVVHSVDEVIVGSEMKR